jgi:F0F1-type ATP synthase membrane subunit b/b'
MAAEYRAKLEAADKAAYEEAQKVVKEGIAARTAILLAAQEESRKRLDAERETIAREKSVALQSMDAQVRALSSEVAAAASGGAASPNDFSLG